MWNCRKKLRKYNLGSSDKFVTTSGRSLYFQTNFRVAKLPKQEPNTKGGKNMHTQIFQLNLVKYFVGSPLRRTKRKWGHKSPYANTRSQPPCVTLGGSSTSKKKWKERENDKKNTAEHIFLHQQVSSMFRLAWWVLIWFACWERMTLHLDRIATCLLLYF